jgi:hypothetical protein
MLMEDTEYLPSFEAAKKYRDTAKKLEADCMKCNHLNGIQCMKAWKITHDEGTFKCFFFELKYEFLKKEDFTL